jgi:ferritin
MRISSNMAKAINDQISFEASSANAYTAIGSWCERTGYDGSAAFFFEQANEENGPPGNFESLEATFQFGLKSEQAVTRSIYDLVDMTEQEKDRSTYSFLQWFIIEQIEEETLFQTILQKFDLLGRDKLAVYKIDQTLASIRSQVGVSK